MPIPAQGSPDLMRLGFLLSPPIVGMIADATSLRADLLIIPSVGILVILFSGVLSPRVDKQDPAA